VGLALGVPTSLHAKRPLGGSDRTRFIGVRLASKLRRSLGCGPTPFETEGDAACTANSSCTILMSAATDVQTVNITVNGTPLQVPKGELIVESIKRLGLDVPIFCYHPRMKPVGMCRMCLVEMGSKGPDGSVRMMPKPQTACSLPATEGLVIVTDSEKIHQDRKGVLEFLLINHPLDCPICDRGGECPLQNNTLFYGPSTSRFIESKRHAPKAFPLSRYVTLDLERCIQCGRCVRFTEEISGDAQLAFRFRGASMQPSTFELRDFSSKFSGNVIEICPVGALTNASYRFRARPWDLETRPAICTNCGNGCNVFLDHRDNTLVRVNGRTNEEVNEEWTCDRGKFGHGYYNSDRRLSSVLVREGVRLVPSSWPEAFRRIKESFGPAAGKVALIGGSSNSNEDVFAVGKLFRLRFGAQMVSFFAGLDHLPFTPKLGRRSTIKEFESKKAVLIFGSDLSDEEPILYLRIRKGWLNHGTKVVLAASKETDVDGFATSILRYRPGAEAALADLLAKAVASPDANLDGAEDAVGVSPLVLRDAADQLRGEDFAIVTTYKLFSTPDAPRTLDILRSMQGTFDCFPLVANGAGAELIADHFFEQQPTTGEILRACVEGQVKALWVVGEDLLDYPDQDLVHAALEAVDYLVVQDVMETELTSYASLALPMTAPAESDGTWTNVEGRVQRMRSALKPRGDSKPLWLTASELSMSLEPTSVPYSTAEVMDLIAEAIPAFAGISYAGIPAVGQVL
jgi:NADH-quinone oxidoreductase subunit G